MADLSSIAPASTYSAQITTLASQLMAKDREPLQALQQREDALNQRASVLGTLATKLGALKSAVDAMNQPGTLSPFAPMTAQVSDPGALGVSTTTGAVAGTYNLVVNQLAKASTFASNVYADSGTAIAGPGTGTYTFSLGLGGASYAVSVAVSAGETDRTVLNDVAAAINAALGGKATAVVVTESTGQSRLSLTSAGTGTSNSITFTDTDGLLGQLGLTNAGAATNSAGGYIYKDLGNHELDASVTLNGLTVFRETNTIGDLVNGLTFALKAANPNAPLGVTVEPDSDSVTATVKDFIAKYNDVLSFLAQNTHIDTKGGQSGVLAFDPIFGQLGGLLRMNAATLVSSVATGPNSLMGLGITPGDDGQLSITDETAFKNLVRTSPQQVAAVFASAGTGVATALSKMVGGYTGPDGTLSGSQNEISLEIKSVDDEMARMNDTLARRQAALEDELAREQQMLQTLNDQSAQMQQIIAAMSSSSSSATTG